jgi:preprotein translocase subunit YajC
MLAVNDVAVGTKLLIAGGLAAEVIENIGDGEWLRIRILSGDDTGTEELCHATDVLQIS